MSGRWYSSLIIDIKLEYASDTWVRRRIMLGKIPQSWFEMKEYRKRKFSGSVWIPLRSLQNFETEIGGEEYFYSACVAFPPENKKEAEKLGWSDIGVIRSGGPFAYSDHSYKSAEVYQYEDGKDMGIDLIFEQRIGCGHENIWHINQDMIIALGLIQEGDIWVRPAEGYVDVIRMKRNDDDKIVAIEIKSEFLRDYLAARGLLLRLVYYRQRSAMLRDKPDIDWPNGRINIEEDNNNFSAFVCEVDEHGGPYGGGVAFTQIWRTDIDSEEDVPIFGPENEENTEGRFSSFQRLGDKFYLVEGELWREEWIEPSERSERVRGDDSEENINYIVGSSGERQDVRSLNHEDIGKYLWFSPRVFNEIIVRRGAGVRWHTRDTGSIWLLSDWTVHFGINKIGLINVYAYDVAKLPVWQQKIWLAYNTSPDGAVSSELLDAQMRTFPARTKAPEDIFPRAIDDLDKAMGIWLGKKLFQEHDAAEEIIKSIHRFRAIDESGFLSLSKDIARLVVDRIVIENLHKVVAPPKGEKWGSLKSLEKVLSTIIDAGEARKLLSPLVGVYNLRLLDAHLPSSNVESAMALAGVPCEESGIFKGSTLIDNTGKAILKIIEVVDIAVENRDRS
ncbi:hypothetical protein EI613_28630 [Azospirillum sp. 412522]|nr:hypothetical protein [Azospirillum sp. 412522]MBY6265853.1 hypothetical protein [Azospirillum sp. 412522]